MPHLAVVAALSLAVIVKMPLRIFMNQAPRTGHVLSQDIDHHDWTHQFDLRQRPVADCPIVNRELRKVAGLDRVVARVVRPGCQFINVELTICADKHLDAQDAFEINRFGNLLGHLLSALLPFNRHPGGHDAQVQNFMGMNVFTDWKDGNIAIGIARYHN